MKKLLVLIFVLVAVTSVTAQNYFPMPDSNAVWRTNWSNLGCTNLGLPGSMYQYLLTGDTIINNQNYVKIERTGFISPYCPPYSYGRQIIGYQGAYRNDVAEKKVYYVFPDSTNEILLYDFSLAVGDTIKGYFATPNVTICQDLKVSSVDTIVLNNQQRRRLNVTGSFCGYDFIEGIGSTHGLLESPQTMEEAGELICFTQNDTLIYLSNPFETCEIISSSEEFVKPDNIKIHPNPVKGSFTITISHIENPVTIEIYDLMGVCWLKRTNIVSNQTQIDVSSLPAGLYIVKTSNGSQLFGVMKIVITK